MSQRWEFGPEYQKLSDSLRKAQREKDETAIRRIKPRLDELNEIMWKSVTNSFPLLAPYSSLVDALEQLSLKNKLPFPDLNDREKNFTGKGDWKESQMFIFGVSNVRRSIQIFPMENHGYIDVEVYEGDNCYKGQTSSIEEAAIVLNRWYVQECTIEELHQQFSWIPIKPLKLSDPRIRYDK